MSAPGHEWRPPREFAKRRSSSSIGGVAREEEESEFSQVEKGDEQNSRLLDGRKPFHEPCKPQSSYEVVDSHHLVPRWLLCEDSWY